MRLVGRLVHREDLSSAERAEMLRLMHRHYTNVQPDVFFRDLDKKRWAIVVQEADSGRLCGFSTQTLLEGEWGGEKVTALFSGDTIIDRSHWGDPALAHVWGQLALTLIDTTDEPLFWFLLSQGYRTYRYLPLFFHSFFPCHEQPTPRAIQKLFHALGESHFKPHFDRAAGIVRSHEGQYALRPGVGDITVERLQNKHVAFFEQLNPGWTQGDELCCLAPLSRENFTSAAYRVIGPHRAPLEVR